MLRQHSPIHQTRTPHFCYRYPPSILYPHPPRSPRLSCWLPRLEGCQPITPHKPRRQRRSMPSPLFHSYFTACCFPAFVRSWNLGTSETT
ncbi:hypothetical protein EDB85DRAFT_2274821 [Lactarius pseudohatsudake]|nr:hypothetical protein EDB85DRAFT_2274821 [Lactarius pseudohatsudake]